jgi:hypothetical protein
MSMIRTMVGLGASVAAIAAAAPASAQYYSGYGYSQPYSYSQSYGYSQPYGYSQSYSQPYGYSQYGYSQPYVADTSVATQQCTAAVQNRLYSPTSLRSILGSLVGIQSNRGQVLSITQVSPRGLASSGRYASNGYGAYGMGAYGALGYGYNNAADLSFRCDVGPNGAVYNVDIRRR